MKNTVIKITTKKDYDAVMRKLEETGILFNGGLRPTEVALYTKNMQLDIRENIMLIVFKQTPHDRGYKDYHFTTAKKFLREEKTINLLDEKIKGVSNESVIPSFNKSPDNTELIKLLREAVDMIETSIISHKTIKTIAKLLNFADQLEESTSNIEWHYGRPDYPTMHPKPKKIEHLTMEESFTEKVDELIDAINEMRGSK